MKYNLWIDDLRNPDWTPHGSSKTTLLWARDVEQAQYYVLNYGLPLKMYLDHDLGNDETVMDFLKWLEQSGRDPTFSYYVISANPDGARAIVSFIESWKRSTTEGGSRC
jgi:hypothetical protein